MARKRQDIIADSQAIVAKQERLQQEFVKEQERLQQELLLEQERLQNELDSIEGKRIEDMRKIEDLTSDYFCGVILSLEDITNILQVMFSTNGKIKIPFNLYLKED